MVDTWNKKMEETHEVWHDKNDTYWYLERYYGVPKPRWIICATDKLEGVIADMVRMRSWDIEGAPSLHVLVEYRLRCCKTGEIIPGDAIV